MRLIVLLLIVLFLTACDRQKPEAPQASADAPSGKGLDRSHKGKSAPDVNFLAPDGGETSLAELEGPVLVNLWASWCAPCVKELPTLNALARRQGRDGALKVVAVSQDIGAQASVESFLAKLKVADLGAYHDPEMKLTDALGVRVMPTTVLYDAAGREVWRYVGDLDWTGSEAKALLAEVSPGATR
ncbi:MAG: TlpA family protein disulfide reductase [Pseudomonadota bacterium]|nr:TlpA family protein disulfide reductase [Pseudomonadota bacterium]